MRTLLKATDIQCDIPHFRIDKYGGDAKEIARMVRASLQLSRGPVQDLTQVLEDAGILVISFDFETPLVDVISRWIPLLPPLFFVHQQSPKDRCRWSLAHELGHIVMHELPNPDMEEQADQFAAEFLLPERDAFVTLQDLDLVKLTVLKRYWRVSMAALLKRAEDLNASSPHRAHYLWSQMSKAGYKTREPLELDVTGERPQLLYELIGTYTHELNYSKEDLQEILALNPDELQQQYLQDPSQPSLRIIHGSQLDVVHCGGESQA